MYLWRISALLGALLCFSVAPVLAMTCDECNELDKQMASTREEMTKQDAELQRAFDKKDLAKVRHAERQTAELSKKLVDLETSKAANCKDACNPEVVKKTECEKLLSEIAVMEADAKSAETNKEKIDEKYKALLNCHKELQHLTQDKR